MDEERLEEAKGNNEAEGRKQLGKKYKRLLSGETDQAKTESSEFRTRVMTGDILDPVCKKVSGYKKGNVSKRCCGGYRRCFLRNF